MIGSINFNHSIWGAMIKKSTEAFPITAAVIYLPSNMSIILKSERVRDDFPLPVRPQMPTYKVSKEEKKKIYNYRLITAYLLLRVNLYKIMHAR